LTTVVTPFAATVCFAFGDTKNLIKLLTAVRCGAQAISAAAYMREIFPISRPTDPKRSTSRRKARARADD
jgi:hypothetical protein